MGDGWWLGDMPTAYPSSQQLQWNTNANLGRLFRIWIYWLHHTLLNTCSLWYILCLSQYFICWKLLGLCLCMENLVEFNILCMYKPVKYLYNPIYIYISYLSLQNRWFSEPLRPSILERKFWAQFEPRRHIETAQTALCEPRAAHPVAPVRRDVLGQVGDHPFDRRFFRNPWDGKLMHHLWNNYYIYYGTPQMNA